jgi:transcriptional regulator with XRE-family HTH domain
MVARSGGRVPGESPAGPESIGALLTRLRLARGWSQLRVAQRLCAAAGLATVSRHEVSRWEREDRVPGEFWLGWLAVVLEAPVDQLEAAVAATRGGRGCAEPGRLWRAPTATELLAALDGGGSGDLRDLAHAWLAGPPDPPALRPVLPVRQWRELAPTDALDRLDVRLRELRRMDDLVGGVDLAEAVEAHLRTAISVLGRVDGASRRRALRLVAGCAQLAGWVHADAADPAAARHAYRVGLRAAAAAADRPLAAHVLGGLSQLSLATGAPHEALLLARTGRAGARPDASALTEALLLHRVALAAAWAGERRAAHSALAAAERAAELADRGGSGREPDWLYWLDPAELSAMTGRCLAVLGRPLRAARLLAPPGRARPTGPRAAAIHAGWLARAYLDLGEVEQACRVAARALRDAVRSGSARAATGLRQLHPVLLRHRELPAVRGYERLAAAAAGYLPEPAGSRRERVPVPDSVEA